MRASVLLVIYQKTMDIAQPGKTVSKEKVKRQGSNPTLPFYFFPGL